MSNRDKAIKQVSNPASREARTILNGDSLRGSQISIAMKREISARTKDNGGRSNVRGQGSRDRDLFVRNFISSMENHDGKRRIERPVC